MTEDRAPQRTREVENEPTAAGRRLPHNLDAEASLLGAALLSETALEILATETTPEDYYKPAHGHVAAVLIRAFEEGWSPDVVTVADALRNAGLLEQIGGPVALVELQTATPATGNAARYARIVHDHATLRRVLSATAKTAELAYGRPDDAHDVVERARALFDDVSAQNGSRAYSTLEIADVSALLDGDLEAEDPVFLRRNDGRALLYPGKMHMLQGEPSAGKSWLACVAALEVLPIGGSVLYLDYEDTSKGILGRLLAVGAEPADVRERFAYVQPAGPFGPAEKIELDRIVKRLNPDLIVIDGVGAALSRDGYSEDKAPDYMEWVEKLPRPLARTGAAVVMLDHVVKNPENQGRWARGTGAKLAAVDGASYIVKVTSAFSRQKPGSSRIIIAKDRPGGVGGIGETAAVMQIEPKADGTRVLIRLERDVDAIHAADAWKPTVIMAKVSDEIARSTVPLTASAVKNLVHSAKPRLVTEAIARLVVEGYLAEIKQGRTVILRSVKPYDDGRNPPGPTEPPPELDLEPAEQEGIHLVPPLPDPTDPGPIGPGHPNYF